jgi:hypothetical protein
MTWRKVSIRVIYIILPQWIPEELSQIEALGGEIAACPRPRLRTPLSRRLDLKLSDTRPLIEGLGGNTRALLVRQLLRALDFDEQHHLRWRLEHKLIQALVLRAWIPCAVPVTCGLAAFVRTNGAACVRDALARNFPVGYRIKLALGDSSGEAPPDAAGGAILSAIETSGVPADCPILDEQYIVQEQIPIATEYRVHSLEDDVIEDLTFRRYEGGSIPGERDAPNAFVQSLLGQLPDALVSGSLLAWDVALQPSGEYSVIEVNFSGFHPVFKRGFHCSGYFHDRHWGACDTARLLNHVAAKDRVEVEPRADAPEFPLENRFYWEAARWQMRHLGIHVSIPPPVLDARPESELAAPILSAIDAFDGLRRRPPVDGELSLRLSDAIPLLPEIAATSRALLTRQAMLAMGFDEHRLTPWRLEHKLVQAHVFRRYCPQSVPPTCGLDRLMQGVDVRDLRRTLAARFPERFVIKTGLGDCSGNEIDYRTEAALVWLESSARYMPGAGALTDEEFIVQERKRICWEYRVHTVEDRVIEDLTVRRHQGTVAPGEREAPNAYVQQMLDALPAGITAGSIFGWDVALLEDGGFATIEVNVAGIHPVYHPGFHVSGFFHHQHYGAIYSARLLLFLERTYNCRIHVIADAPDHPEENYFYSEVADWKARF